MPAGREKFYIRGVQAPNGAGTLPFVITAPAPPRSNIVVVAHLLWLASIPVADETVEQFGNASTRGYRLEVLTTGAVRMTAYRAGPANTTATSSNVLTAADANKFFLAIGVVTSGNVSVYLNTTITTTIQASPMVIQAAPGAAGTGGDDRILIAQDVAGTGRINAVRACQNWSINAAFPGTLALAQLFGTTREAQRLEEPDCASYIDFGRYNLGVTTAGVTTGLPFGDDRTGGTRVGLAGAPYPQPAKMRANRLLDWSTA